MHYRHSAARSAHNADRRAGVGGGVRIDVHDVGVTRNGHTILHDVNLTIGPGELVAIIGASGAGKSTLLDAIAGIRPPTSGTVHIDGVQQRRAEPAPPPRLRPPGRSHPPRPARRRHPPLRSPAPHADRHASR